MKSREVFNNRSATMKSSILTSRLGNKKPSTEVESHRPAVMVPSQLQSRLTLVSFFGFAILESQTMLAVTASLAQDRFRQWLIDSIRMRWNSREL